MRITSCFRFFIFYICRDEMQEISGLEWTDCIQATTTLWSFVHSPCKRDSIYRYIRVGWHHGASQQQTVKSPYSSFNKRWRKCSWKCFSECRWEFRKTPKDDESMRLFWRNTMSKGWVCGQRFLFTASYLALSVIPEEYSVKSQENNHALLGVILLLRTFTTWTGKNIVASKRTDPLGWFPFRPIFT